MAKLCAVCGHEVERLKRCSRCQNVFYCSISCQKLDWPGHKDQCKPKSRVTQPASATANDQSQPSVAGSGQSHPSPDQLDQDAGDRESGFVFYDGSGRPTRTAYPPEYFTHPADAEVTVKAGGAKLKLSVNCDWSGHLIYKLMSSLTRIPLDEMKVIVRGKVQTAESVAAALTNKLTVMVVGAAVEDSTGVDERDIECLMRQMNVNRSAAVRSLKKNKSLVDCVIDLGNNNNHNG